MKRMRRRSPTQARARATIDDVLAAAARIMERDGYDALTTNRVARIAGVSVGTLYQYFESKEAIVAALQNRHFEKMGRPLLARMQELSRAPLDEYISEIASLFRSSELLNSRLSKRLLAVPLHDKPSAVVRLEQQLVETLYDYLVRLAPHAEADLLRIRIFIVVQTTEALIISTSQQRPRGLTRQRFTNELATLVMRYLGPSLMPSP